MSEIYDKTNIFKAYYGQVSEDARLAGVTDEVTLPNFENVSETLNLAGTVGEIDSPSAGQYKSATIDIPFTQVSKEAFGIMCDDSTSIILKSVQEIFNTETLKKTHIVRTITIKGMTKGHDYGKLKKGGYGNPTIKKEVIYYKDQVGEDVIEEIDKFNGKAVINGEDVLGNVASLI
nr:MAG TPA: tail tube protein [Caudoviricetes sp.]